MLIQSTRYLNKLYKNSKKGKTISIKILSYINDIPSNINKVFKAKTVEDLCKVDQVIEALEVSSSYAIMQTFDRMESSDIPKKVLENDIYALDLLKVAYAHLFVLTVKIYKY